MDGLTLHRLRFTLRAAEPLSLDQHSGSAIRGALFNALLDRFCVMRDQLACADCPVQPQCPVATLVAPLRDESPRGRDIPRPFVIRPPLIPANQTTGKILARGETSAFELILVGAVTNLFPYVIQAALAMEQVGMGRPIAGRRGRFIIERIEAIPPIGEPVTIFQRDQPRARLPESAITPAAIAARAEQLAANQICLRFLTPMRLIANSQIAHTPDPTVLLARLAERLDALEREYAPVPIPISEAPDRPVGRWRAVALGANLRVDAISTAWVDVKSYSARQKHATPIGGFVGTVTFVGPLSPQLRELFAWGELLHIGKDAVKGNGWYQIEP